MAVNAVFNIKMPHKSKSSINTQLTSLIQFITWLPLLTTLGATPYYYNSIAPYYNYRVTTNYLKGDIMYCVCQLILFRELFDLLFTRIAINRYAAIIGKYHLGTIFMPNVYWVAFIRRDDINNSDLMSCYIMTYYMSLIFIRERCLW